MNKAEKIVEFIRTNKPRYTDLVRFIAVDLNKKLTSKEWDALPSTDSIRKYYATNIGKWKRQGNVVVDKNTKRYSMSKFYSGHLYGITNKVENEMLEQRSRHFKNLAKQTRETLEVENRILKSENQRLKQKLKDILEVII